MVEFARKHPEVVAPVALTLVPLALLGHALLPGRVLSPADLLLYSYPWKALAPGLVPANPMMTDVTQLFHPWAIYAGREIRQGRFPLWNPHVFTGAPFFANPESRSSRSSSSRPPGSPCIGSFACSPALRYPPP